MDLTGLSLPPDIAGFVHEKVEGGYFANEGEVIHAALVLLRDQERARALRLEELRAKIRVGLDELERGEGQPLDMDDIRAEVHRKLAASTTNR